MSGKIRGLFISFARGVISRVTLAGGEEDQPLGRQIFTGPVWESLPKGRGDAST